MAFLVSDSNFLYGHVTTQVIVIGHFMCSHLASVLMEETFTVGEK